MITLPQGNRLARAIRYSVATATAVIATTLNAAQNWYVNPASGNDTSNSGTSTASPLKTLQAAHNKTNPGDTVWLMGGTYTGGSTYSLLDITRSGNASQGYVTYKAMPGQTPVLRAEGMNCIRIAANYIRIEGLTLTGYLDNRTQSQGNTIYDFIVAKEAAGTPWTTADYAKIAPTNTNGIYASNCHHIQVIGCTVSKFPGAGIAASQADYLTFERNVVHSTSWYTAYATSGISILNPVGWSASDTNTGFRNFIINNRVYNNKTLVKWWEYKRYSDGNGIIADSIRSTYPGKTLVANNIAYNNGGTGIHAFKSYRVRIVNNTLYNNSLDTLQTSAPAQGGLQACNGSTFANNIIYGRSGRAAVSNYVGAPAPASGNTVTHNLFYLATPTGSNAITGDPLFTTNGSNFTLRTGSPGINSGTGTFAPSVDFAYTPRPIGVVDRGAYER